MRKLNKYLSSQLKERDPFYDWKLMIDNEKQVLEMFILLKIDNPKRLYVQDESGKVSNASMIHYEQVLCFYDINSPFTDPENYVFAAPISEQGIECGLVDAVLKQLNIYVNELYSSLQEFILNSEASELVLPEWNLLDFQNTIQTLKDIQQYNYEKLTIDFNIQETK